MLLAGKLVGKELVQPVSQGPRSSGMMSNSCSCRAKALDSRFHGSSTVVHRERLRHRGREPWGEQLGVKRGTDQHLDNNLPQNLRTICKSAHQSRHSLSKNCADQTRTQFLCKICAEHTLSRICADFSNTQLDKSTHCARFARSSLSPGCVSPAGRRRASLVCPSPPPRSNAQDSETFGDSLVRPGPGLDAQNLCLGPLR